MRKSRVVLGMSLVLVCAVAFAIPPEFKNDLKEPRDLVTKAKANVYYKKQYDDAGEQRWLFGIVSSNCT